MPLVLPESYSVMVLKINHSQLRFECDIHYTVKELSLGGPNNLFTQ